MDYLSIKHPDCSAIDDYLAKSEARGDFNLRDTWLILADVCGRFAKLLASLVVEFGEVDSRDRPTGHASLNIVK